MFDIEFGVFLQRLGLLGVAGLSCPFIGTFGSLHPLTIMTAFQLVYAHFAMNPLK